MMREVKDARDVKDVREVKDVDLKLLDESG